MKTALSTKIATILIAAATLAVITGQVWAQVSAAYSGDISTTFGPVTDRCSFEFGLYDATAGGSGIGPIIERTLDVENGRFSTDLDFGPGVLENGSHYLEVAVGCPADTAALTTLTRRAVSPTPPRDAVGRSPGGVPSAIPPESKTMAALGTAFTYQGELKQSGEPVTGQADMIFHLWDAQSGGVEVAAMGLSFIDVIDGRFTTTLDFGAEVFDGDARWLEIEVEYPSGVGTWTTLSPRQGLSATPYALQTRGIFVDDAGKVGVGTTSPQAPLHIEGDSLRTIKVRNTSSSGGAAIQATASAGAGFAMALDAYSASPDGATVYAFNEAESGNAYGVSAETVSPAGVAIFGHASNNDQSSDGIGVYGLTDSDQYGTGVYGKATAATGYNYGVQGITAKGAGVMGYHTGTSNSGALGIVIAGVYGYAGSGSSYAGYFTGGDVRVDGGVALHTTSGMETVKLVPGWETSGGGQLGLRLASGLQTIELDAQYGADGGGRMAIQGGGDHSVIHATGAGSGQYDATLRVINTQTTDGVAAYATSNSDGSTVRIENDGPGETLWLENSGGGDLLVARDGDLGETQFWVDGSGVTHAKELEVAGDISTAGGYAFDSDRTFFVNIPATAFHKRRPITDPTNLETLSFISGHLSWHPYILLYSTNGGIRSTDIISPVKLPHGAVVQRLEVYYQDNDASENLEILAKIQYSNFPEDQYHTMALASRTTSGAIAGIKSFAEEIIGEPIIDNNGREYSCVVYLEASDHSSDLRFYGVQIEYTISELNP